MKRIETFIQIIHDMGRNIRRCPNDSCRGCSDSSDLIMKLCNDIVEIIEQIERNTESSADS